MNATPGFTMRAVYECGWNLFYKEGYSLSSRGETVNFSYLDHLSEAGINWLVVFWANGPAYDASWAKVVPYAHARGIKVARGVYGFSGGGPEHTMAEPLAPEHLLRDSLKGPRTALCPHDAETQQWMAEQLRHRVQPDIDGIFIEPAQVISRNCTCERCRRLLPHGWDVFVVNQMTDVIKGIRPDVVVIPYVQQAGGRRQKEQMAEAYGTMDSRIRTIVSWGSDDEGALVDWLEADPRFSAFTKLGRVMLFPDGTPPTAPVEERVKNVFRWCRLAAERGKEAYVFDYRIFGGRERQGHHQDEPCTRVSARMPASLGVIGAALANPYLDGEGQARLLQRLRHESDWDLENPEYYYRG